MISDLPDPQSIGRRRSIVRRVTVGGKFTDAEAKSLAKRAASRSQLLGEWARESLLTAERGQRRDSESAALFGEVQALRLLLINTLEPLLRELRAICRRRPDLCRMFVQIQLQTALWGGGLNNAAREVLARVCAALGVSAYEVVQMEALLRMQQQASYRPEARPAVDRVAQAYEVLGVARTASDAEVTKAYRRLMNQNHPDKLVAKGLPESMMKIAEEKTRQIRAAYELLREARGMK